MPHLVHTAEAVPDLQPRTVGRTDVGGVEAFVRLRVAHRTVALRLPALRTGAVAVPQLDLGTVGGRTAGDVHALAERPDRAVGADRPPLRVGAVAGPQLDGSAVRGRGGRHVHALAA